MLLGRLLSSQNTLSSHVGALITQHGADDTLGSPPTPIATHSPSSLCHSCPLLFVLLSLSFTTYMALIPALKFSAWDFYLCCRTALVLLVLFVRLGASASVVIPHCMPKRASLTCGSGTLWSWLLKSHALTSALLSLGFPLPMR